MLFYFYFFICTTALLLFLGSTVGIALQFFSDPLAVILIFSCFLMFNGVCVTVINSTVVMIFPTQYRAMAVCCVLMSGRFGTIIGTNIVGQLLESNCVATFWSFTCVIICKLNLFLFNYFNALIRQSLIFSLCVSVVFATSEKYGHLLAVFSI